MLFLPILFTLAVSALGAPDCFVSDCNQCSVNCTSCVAANPALRSCLALYVGGDTYMPFEDDSSSCTWYDCVSKLQEPFWRLYDAMYFDQPEPIPAPEPATTTTSTTPPIDGMAVEPPPPLWLSTSTDDSRKKRSANFSPDDVQLDSSRQELSAEITPDPHGVSTTTLSDMHIRPAHTDTSNADPDGNVQPDTVTNVLADMNNGLTYTNTANLNPKHRLLQKLPEEFADDHK